jgi:alpha-galactosidase
VPKKFGLRQTIADTLGIGGIMRGLRTVPHLWKICEDMLEVCPDAIMLQYVNPMAINTWAIARNIRRSSRSASAIRCRARRTNWRAISIDPVSLRYRAAGINHMAFYLKFEQRHADGSIATSIRTCSPATARALPQAQPLEPRCPNKVRYEMLTRLGYFVTESSEHFAEYTPWFIKEGREDLIEKFGIPLDEYPKRCVEQIARWKERGGDLQDRRDTDRGQGEP